jgi:hypothetical protein
MSIYTLFRATGITKAVLFIIIIGLLGLQGIVAQAQRSISWNDVDGTRYIIDSHSGLRAIGTGGKTTERMDSRTLQEMCTDMDKQTFLDENAKLWALACEYWHELQPRTQIEKLPFPQLIARLLIVSPRSTDFGRYRGIKLESDGPTTRYDATIVPDGIGDQVSCSIIEAPRDPGEMSYFYECSVKTSSYEQAIKVQKALLSTLSELNLTEDQVKEHGFAASAHTEQRCAPFTGECEHQHMFISVLTDGKLLSLEANPDFTYNIYSIMAATKSKKAPLPSEVNRSSGTVKFDVYAVENVEMKAAIGKEVE